MIKTQRQSSTFPAVHLTVILIVCSLLQISALRHCNLPVSSTPLKNEVKNRNKVQNVKNNNGRSFNFHTYLQRDPFTDLSNDIITDELNSNDVSFVSIQPPTYSGTKKDIHLDETVKSEEESTGDDLNTLEFGSIFRQCAPYIAMHRGSTMVVHLGGQALNEREDFDAIIDDLSILHLLGVQLVLVAGVRKQLDEKLLAVGKVPQYHDGMRVSDEETMKYLKETSGSARFEIESSLARGFRGRPGQSGISVVSGNFFYSAKPLGVRDGVDFKLTGEVRRIEVENLKKRLEAGDVVMLTSVGYSPSGEVFNVPSESLAAECAARLKAAKIIYLTDGESMVDTRSGKHVQSLRLAQAVSLLDACGIKTDVYNQVEDQENKRNNGGSTSDYSRKEDSLDSFGNVIVHADVTPMSAEALRLESCGMNSSVAGFVRLLARCVYALSGGVRRAHLIAPSRGALLKELYTRDGAGILVSRDVYEGIRQAQPSDVRTVEDIIKPLEDQGILVPRGREQLEKDMQDCFLMTRDGSTLACGMLKKYSDTHGEVCCLAVHPSYRREGRGETLLAYLERRALLMGITQLFVLSTRTMQWFEERGFVLSDPSLLPSTRQYNKSRGSKVYIKVLRSQRDVDAEELLWNV